MKPDKVERLDRASFTAMRGERFRMFTSDPDIVSFFDAYERDRVREMLAADPSDDAKRRDAALKINAMRDLRSFMASAIAHGDRAAETLKRENT